MIRAAVIGHPVSHSLSPVIHGYWFKKYNIEGRYEAIDIQLDGLKSLINTIQNEDFSGFNVTVPHKQNIMALCDALDETARAIGAVNTIVIKNGKLEGRNTDAFGFIANIRQTLPDYNFQAAPALVLGAGGAARAVIYGLLQEGVPEIRLANRTRENAEVLARDFKRDFKNVKVVDWDNRVAASNDIGLLTNTTVLGMQGQGGLDMDLSRLPDKAAVCDIVYKPLMTTLLENAKKRNLSFATGIGMLLHQARPAFAAWTGIMPEVTKELEDLVRGRAG